MARPSGGGSEVLKRAYKGANDNAWFIAIDGVANHIYTIISIVVTEAGGAEEALTMRLLANGSSSAGDEAEFVKEHTLPAKSTFVWNDRIVLTGTDHLEIYTTAGNCDIWVSYIDQDWT